MINNKLTILLVEDDSLLAMTESHWMTRAGYSVIHSISGELAIETVKDKKNQIDLILMDINLGTGIDGTKAAREILKENDLPILFLSSHTEKEVVEKTEQITSYGYVIKDSKDVVLLASIKMAFKLHQVNKQLRDKEKALKESKGRLQRAEFISKIGHWEYQPEFRTMIASDGAVKIYELSEYKVHLSEIRKRTLPEYHAMLDSAMKNLIELNDPYDIEFKIRKQSDGKIVDIRSIAEYDKEENKVFGTIQDITDQKSAEAYLEESREKYRILTESMKDVVWVLDTETRYFLYVSPSVESLRGFTAEEVMSLPADASLTQEAKEGIIDLTLHRIEEFLSNKNSGKYYIDEIEQPCKDGSLVWVETITRYYLNEKNGHVELRGVTRDITERKNAEKEIENSLSILEATLDSTVDGILVIDKSGKILKYNKKFAEMSYIPNGALSLNDKKVIDLVIDRVKNPETFLKKIDQLSINPDTVSFDIIELKDGRIFERYSNPQLINGKAVGRVLSFRDVTEKKIAEEAIIKSENMFVTAFQRSPIAISISSIENGKYYDINEIFVKQSGYAREDIIGHTSLDLNIFSNYEERARLTEEVIKNGFIYDSECHFRRKNGEIVLCLISIVKVIIGHNAYFLSSILNISERKQSEIRLQKLTEELKLSNMAKDKFFSIISHDLKNPFHSINAALKLLLNEEDSFTSQEKNVFLRSILTTSERAYSLLENLLLWSREQMGNVEFEPEMIEIVELVIESIKHLEQNAALKNITVSSYVKNNIFVNADRNMIEIVLRNLLANAIKFTGDKGKINIEAFESNGYVRISVIDNGIGIHPEDIDKLFRIDRSYSTRGTKGEEGTGLGLIICKDFIEINEGKIWVESELGKGSKFTFELPIRKSNK